jgi:hypothetical protein
MCRPGGVPLEALQFAAFALVLVPVALLAPAPGYSTDRDVYETTGQKFIVPDCGSIHCFRPLVPWIVERFPGPPILRWKLYAALLNAAAGVAVGRLATVLGLTPSGALIAAALSAFGFGAMFTAYDPHTADPLMFAAAPFIVRELWLGRIRFATIVSGVAVFAKEFGAAPLWIFTIVAALERRWRTALTLFVAANAVTLLWIVLQLTLILGFQYNYGGNASADVFHGGYIRYWLGQMSVASALSAVFGVFGPLYLLAAAGAMVGGAQWRHLALAAVPAVLLLCYVQQPDRALWNFHFILVPMAVVVLERVPALVAWAFVASVALANMRIGAQLRVAPPSRFSLAIGITLALAAIVWVFRHRPFPPPAAHMSVS